MDYFFLPLEVKELVWDKLTISILIRQACVRIMLAQFLVSCIYTFGDRLPRVEMIGDREGTRLDLLQKKIRDITS